MIASAAAISEGYVNLAGATPPTAITNAQPLDNTSMFGQLAAALANTDCGKWFQAGLATSGRGNPGQSLASFLNTLPTIVGSATFVGGNANAVEGTPAPGYVIPFNSAGAFFNPVPSGQTIGVSNQYSTQFASIQGGSAQAQAFLMLHEIGHLFNMLRPDATSDANQAVNNDNIWRNCSSVIQSFSNTGPSQ
jgi:hypothetical protein